MPAPRRAAFGLLPALATLAATRPVSAAEGDYPNRPIRLVVPFIAGGSVDLLSRAVAQALGKELGKPVVVENRPGGTTVIGTTYVARSAPDGYTLLSGGDSVELNRYLMASLPYDPDRDLVPILKLADVPYVLVVNSRLPVQSLQDLIAHAKARSGELTYASFGIGGVGHLSGELLARMAGIEILHIPYPGNPPALLDVAAGRVAMMFCTIPLALPELQSGRVRAVAMSSPRRVPVLAEVPTLAEAGLPGYAATSQMVLYAPGGVSPEIVRRLNAATRRAMGDPDFTRLLDAQGFVLAQPRSAEEIAAMIRKHTARWAEVIRAAGIHL
jgi:tripartite-type tricarboxylate transporter receptor subunit TctC